MKPWIRFEWTQWAYKVLLWFIIMAICVPIRELIAAPAVVWLLVSPSYDQAFPRSRYSEDDGR